jgi:L-fucose isomerase-like protein
MATTTLGILIGNRDFFPDALIGEGRNDILSVCKAMGIDTVLLDENDTKLGAIESHSDARKCAALFQRHRDKIDGLLVVLPNFGDEKGIADAIQMSGLNVPVLIQAYPDDLDKMNVERRRDAFCGKVSVCNNLYQYNLKYTLTTLHTVHPTDESFKTDLQKFVAVCRTVKGLRNARLGAIGARPNAFNTTRYSEKLLQAFGISVSTLDLSEVFGRAARLGDEAVPVKAKLDTIKNYVPTAGVPPPSILRMAKLGVVIDDWMQANDLDATAIQCWTSLQQNFGVNVCTLMSFMSDKMMPSACEVDITGVLSMYALQLASGQPAALVDWNNNYASNPDKCVLFHCGNWAKSFYPSTVKMANAPILGSTLGVENTYGALDGGVSAGPMSFARVTTDDKNGAIKAYVGDGDFTDDPLPTFGSRAVVHVPELQKLMRYICRNGYEHHTAMTMGYTAEILTEVFENYMGWAVHQHLALASNIHTNVGAYDPASTAPIY